MFSGGVYAKKAVFMTDNIKILSGRMHSDFDRMVEKIPENGE